MSNGNLVPATLLSKMYMLEPGTVCYVGSNQYDPSIQNPDNPVFFYQVISLTDLSFVDTATIEDPTNVPQNITQHLNDPTKFLFFATNSMPTYYLPQSNLYQFLKGVGSGPQLDQMQQIVAQSGTGAISYYTYALAATMTNNDMPGFEAGSFLNFSVVPMQFMPVQVSGQTIYAPVQQYGAGVSVAARVPQPA